MNSITKLQSKRASGFFFSPFLFNIPRAVAIQRPSRRTSISCSHTSLGLRWIFEALAGGDLSGIDPEWFVNKNSEKPEEQLPAVKQELARVIEKLQNEVHVIVGHNLFTDLGFLYKTFIGALPANVKHFQEDIHYLFPIVIDTKYLATHGADPMNPRSNLKELLAPFRKTHVRLFSNCYPPSECLAARGTFKAPTFIIPPQLRYPNILEQY
jgi:hypothetical protein